MFGLIFIITYKQVYAAQYNKKRPCSTPGVWVKPNTAQLSQPLTGSSFFTATPSFLGQFLGQFTPFSAGSSLFSTITPSPSLSYFSSGLNSSVTPSYQFGPQLSAPWSVSSGIPNQPAAFTGTQSQPNQVFTFSPPGFAGQSHATGAYPFAPQQFLPNPPTTTGGHKVISTIMELLTATYGNMINALKAGNLHFDNFNLHCYALKIRAIESLSTYDKVNDKQISKHSNVNNIDLVGELGQMVEILRNVCNIFVNERERQHSLLNIERLMSDVTAYQEITKRAQDVQSVFNGELLLWERELNDLQHYLKMLHENICNVTHVELDKVKQEILEAIKPVLNQLGYTLK